MLYTLVGVGVGGSGEGEGSAGRKVEEDLCWIVCGVPSDDSIKGLNWTELNWRWLTLDLHFVVSKKVKLCNILPTLMSVLHVSSGYTCHAHLWKNWSCWWTKTHGSFRSKSSSMVESTCMYAAQSLSRGTEDIFSFLSVFLFSDYGV